MRAHDTALALRTNSPRKCLGLKRIRSAAERRDALENLRGVLGLVEVHREENVMRGEVERRNLARAQEMRDVFHLYEGH